jgi:hypothetical protein
MTHHCTVGIQSTKISTIPVSTAICIHARVFARSLSAAAALRSFTSAAPPLRTTPSFFRLITRSYINVKDEPRRQLARLLRQQET